MQAMLERLALRRTRDARALTDGERAIARRAFGTALDLDRVRIHAQPWLPFQLRGAALAPDGHVWFHAADHRDDFARSPLAQQAWLVHELVHCWQHQQGMAVVLRGAFDRRYRYALEPGKPFAAYGIEQQAEIVAHAFLLRAGASVRDAPPLARYDAVLPF
ncbi:MAG TPA: hypothetical protein VFL14_15975 [Xanthomonadales bacterium]|nr:hypothetical protein [Xanthomonadales bacterium]